MTETDRQTDRDRQTETETDRQTDMQTDREIETDRQTDRQRWQETEGWEGGGEWERWAGPTGVNTRWLNKTGDNRKASFSKQD